LHYLAEKDYGHRFYVDLTPSINDVYIKNRSGSQAWRTILVGGLRAGGRGLYALDVSNGSQFSAANDILWEFTSKDDPDLGYTYSQPSIVMMPNGEWMAIVGNGYNSGEDGDGDGKAKLFILKLEGGLDGAWQKDVDYWVIDTKAGSPTTPNGLSTVQVVDMNGDSVADRVYAGDLKGNMWAFDISGDSSTWGVAYGTTADPKPLFTAKDANGKAQPITTAPIIAFNPNVVTRADKTVSGVTEPGNEPNLLVMFGTGKFLEMDDRQNNDVMSYYSVWDANQAEKLRAQLKSRTLVTAGGFRTITDNGAIDWTSEFGWRMDLATNAAANIGAERVVSGSQLLRKTLLFNTIIPDATICTAGGSGWLMGLDYDTGLTGNHPTFDTNKDGKVTNLDMPVAGRNITEGLPTATVTLGPKGFTPNSAGGRDDGAIGFGPSSIGSLSWEEIFRQ